MLVQDTFQVRHLEREAFIKTVAQQEPLTNAEKNLLIGEYDKIIAAKTPEDAERLTSGEFQRQGEGLFELTLHSKFVFLLELKAFGFRVIRAAFGHEEQ